MARKILITGASGFIGGRIAEDLLGRPGYEVWLQARSRVPRPELAGAAARVFLGNLEDPAFARSSCAGADTIVHCAGLAGTWGPYESYRRANVVATENLLAGAREGGVRCFVNLSSPSISFDFRDQLGVREDWLPKRFSTAYARSKWEAEQAVRAAHSSGIGSGLDSGLMTVSLRPRSVIGRGDAQILPRLIRLREAGALVQVGRGENLVSLTAISNLLDVVRLCLDAGPEAMGETYNVADAAPVRFWEFVDFVLNEAGFDRRPRKKIPVWVAMAAARANQAVHKLLRSSKEPSLLPVTVGVLSRSMTLDISKAREKLGYAPRATAEDAVREFMAAVRRPGRPSPR